MENQTTNPSVSWFTPVLSSRNTIQRRTTFNNNEVIRIVMVGKTGAGKSASGNTILGEEMFKSCFSAKSLTEDCSKVYGEVNGQKVAVIDTPGLFDTNNDEKKTTDEVGKCISLASPGPHIFLIVIRLGRFTEEEKQTVQKLQKLFGEDSDKYCMVLFTHGDLLKKTSIEEFLRESRELQELVAKCNGQYHVFNNDLEDRSQVRELLKKIGEITEKNGGSHYTTDMFQRAEKVIEEEKQRILKEKEEEMCKEQEELEKRIKEKYEKQMKVVKNDLKKQKELRAACEREVEGKIQQLKERQEKQAREEAEKNSSILALIWEVLREYLRQKLQNLRGNKSF